MIMNDTPRHATLRRRLAEQLYAKGIKNTRVLNAIASVPRHLFMNSTLEPFAYNDNAYPIGADQTISQPWTVAYQTELLNPQEGEKVLEIGTGSGYQSAVLACCGASVYSVERIRELSESAQKRLASLNYKVQCKYGDGYEGWAEMAPFDKIIVTAGASEIPQNLLMQCKIGGSIVIPVQEKSGLRMVRLARVSETNFSKEDFGTCAFVPMLKGIM
ncbi:MAG: protein-L-isoaspartate(D-aspartate) O-methyltransferase [Paludibacteraceae bacterium]|nr:protein-L-isoaspartate(D-aspartate) O-methyltransferase [Paludibacteraceae bacterium]